MILICRAMIRFAPKFSPINLNRIQYWIANNRLDPSKPITLRELNKSRCLHGVAADGVKLLARGAEELTTPIHIVVSRASAAAIEAVEKAGGTVTTRYYTPFAVKKIKKGEMDPIHSFRSQIDIPVDEGQVKEFHYRLPDPVSRKALEYYRDEAHRGYLSHLVEEGQTPSLFFRVPGEGKKEIKASKGKVVKASDNRVW
jgi:large subunit ribosomal protein L15